MTSPPGPSSPPTNRPRPATSTWTGPSGARPHTTWIDRSSTAKTSTRRRRVAGAVGVQPEADPPSQGGGGPHRSGDGGDQGGALTFGEGDVHLELLERLSQRLGALRHGVEGEERLDLLGERRVG